MTTQPQSNRFKIMLFLVSIKSAIMDVFSINTDKTDGNVVAVFIKQARDITINTASFYQKPYFAIANTDINGLVHAEAFCEVTIDDHKYSVATSFLVIQESDTNPILYNSEHIEFKGLDKGRNNADIDVSAEVANKVIEALMNAIDKENLIKR